MQSYQIALLRKRAGMSQLELAKKLNTSPSAIGMYEQGRRTPSVALLIDIANLFDVSLDYLITGKEYTGSAVDNVVYPCRPCKACCCCCHKQVQTRNNLHDNRRP